MVSTLTASVNWRRVVVAMLTSDSMILPLMEVSVKSGEAQCVCSPEAETDVGLKRDSL
jgi:hypothetical protein